MLLSVIFLCFQVASVVPMSYEKPVALTLWNERCKPKTVALNDCNWCKCGSNMQYTCSARVCNSVDVFGHFTDAIRDIDVGMEGHGSWRSSQTPCEPGVRYQRDSLLCLCSEDGAWPSPVCRDTFQVLHVVEIPEDKTKCVPTKLYLNECNVCFCPSTGRLDLTLCTKIICNKDDPVLKPKDSLSQTTSTSFTDLYAECEADKEYKLGCRTCICLRNNRLLCGNCTKTGERAKTQQYCETVIPHKTFNVDCNLCYCESQGAMICSAKRCLEFVDKYASRRLNDIDGRYLEIVEAPLDDSYCQIGTKYMKGCNLCLCLEGENGVKMFACSVRACDTSESMASMVSTDCVLQSKYERNCRKCSCVFANGEKWEWCEAESQCSRLGVPSLKFDLNAMHGYCEPLHDYVKDCNRCTCLSNGQTIMSTDLICSKVQQPISVDIVPVHQKGVCPSGHSYKVDCNVCVCLSNGNALCSTLDCKKPY